MNRLKLLKYLFVFTAPALAFLGFYYRGPWTWAVPIYAYGLVPFVELLTKGTQKNMDAVEEEVAKEDRLYDYIIYSMVPLQWTMFIVFMFTMDAGGLQMYESVGLIFSMGIGCGVLG
jgi:alkane 1-monooxygenase